MFAPPARSLPTRAIATGDVTLSRPRESEALRQVAFDERRKIHDLLMEGTELAPKKRGYPTLTELKARWERKGR